MAMDAVAERPQASFSVREFRDALSSFSTGVTIVTARDGAGEPVGMTASSFNSVSVDPPLVLWSVGKSALSAEAFRAADHFAVHVLASDQSDRANLFARSGADKFGGVSWGENADGVPVFDDAVSRFDCSNWAAYEGGDHWILVGHVSRIVRRVAEPLVFSGGSYASASPLATASDVAPVEGGAESPIDDLLIYHLSRAFHQMAHQLHDAVRDAGFTLAEWRILASLHGNITRDLRDLSARTFVKMDALLDMVERLSEAGLCQVTGNPGARSVSSTVEGKRRVQHLFDLGMRLEQEALAGQSEAEAQALTRALRTIIGNTGPAA